MSAATITPLCPPATLLREPEPSVRGASPPSMLARGEAEKRPGRRPLVTHAVRVGGHKIHIGVGFRPDGTVMEFFLDLHKDGSFTRGAAHVIATGQSKALQRGVPLAAVCDTLRSTFFEPAGKVEGHEPDEGQGPPITHAESLFDLVAQVLEREDAVLRIEVLKRDRAASGA